MNLTLWAGMHSATRNDNPFEALFSCSADSPEDYLYMHTGIIEGKRIQFPMQLCTYTRLSLFASIIADFISSRSGVGAASCKNFGIRSKSP